MPSKTDGDLSGPIAALLILRISSVEHAVPNYDAKSHKRFIWRRLRDEKPYFPSLVVRSLYVT